MCESVGILQVCVVKSHPFVLSWFQAGALDIRHMVYHISIREDQLLIHLTNVGVAYTCSPQL